MGGEWLGIIGAVIAAAVGLTALVKQVQESGRRQAEQETLRRDLDHAHDKIRDLECKVEAQRDKVAEMSGDIKHVLKTLEDLTQLFRSHVTGDKVI